MTIREIFNAQKGYLDREKMRFQWAWERTRWAAAIQLNGRPGVKKKDQVKAEDLVVFPWEGEPQTMNSEIDKIKEYREAVKKL